MTKIHHKAQSEPKAHICMMLHAHAPYVWNPHVVADSEALPRLFVESYIPLLKGLYELVAMKVPVRLGIALSPILVEQMNNPVVQDHVSQLLEQIVAESQEQILLAQQKGDEYGAYVAQFYTQLYHRSLVVFEEQWNRNIILATRELVDSGAIEILGHSATHVVPSLHNRRELRFQLETGIFSLMRHFGHPPKTLWSADDQLTPDLLAALEGLEINHIIGISDPRINLAPTTWLDAKQQYCLIAPQQHLIQHIQSANLGYPSDPIYRANEGLQSVRNKQGTLYDPFYAYARAREHARHFIAVLEEQIQRQDQATPFVVACQMELFGVGWFEGGVWLRNVLELLAKSAIHMLTPSQLTQQYPPSEYVPLYTDSILRNGDLAQAAKLVRSIVNHYPEAHDDQERVLNQMVRELLLAQSGDWDRWQNTPSAEYAHQQRSQHLTNIAVLREMAMHGKLLPSARQLFDEMSQHNTTFPFINYRRFGDMYV